jgi:DNA-binding MarR family transcriptional regulator
MPVRFANADPAKHSLVMLHMARESIVKCEDAVCDQADISLQQYQVLRVIKDISGKVTPTIIANFLDRNPNSITLIIDRMEKNDFVKRVVDINDRRAWRLVITPAGEEKYRQADKPSRELSARILSVLSPQEASVLVDLLIRIKEETFKLRHINESSPARKIVPDGYQVSDPAKYALFVFHQTHESLVKCEDTVCTRFDIPLQQYRVLRAIKDIPGQVTPAVVANWLDHNLNTVTLIVDRMEKHDFIKKMAGPDGSRLVELKITEKGEERYQQANKPYRELSNGILSILSREEAYIFMELLTRIREETFRIRRIQDSVTVAELSL